ncbi:MAG: hypothetical protein ACOCUS_07475, partial [Polyangiales bacterium]
MFTASFVPDPERYEGMDILRQLTEEFGTPTSTSTTHALYELNPGKIQLTALVEPAINYLIISSDAASRTNELERRVAERLDRADVERLKQGREGELDGIGWLQLWAVSWLGEPEPDELETAIWEAIGSSDFVERLQGAEAAHILGTAEAHLAIEMAALVEVGPIRAVFESYLRGTKRRSPDRELRFLLDDREEAFEPALMRVNDAMSAREGVSMRSRVGAKFAVLAWRAPDFHLYVVDSTSPRMRFVGVDGADASSWHEKLEGLDVATALELAREEERWLRCCGNVVDEAHVDTFRRRVEEALEADESFRRSAALAAIESGQPSLREMLRDNLYRFQDPHLLNVVREVVK